MNYNRQSMQKNTGDELYYKNNITSLKNSKNLSNILTKNFFKLNHKSLLVKSNSSHRSSIKEINNESNYEEEDEHIIDEETDSKNRIIDIKRYFPVKYLKYEINLNEQNKKYAPNKIFEGDNKKSKLLFIRKKPKKSIEYTPCLRFDTNHLYNKKQLVLCKNKFCSSKSVEVKNIPHCKSARNISSTSSRTSLTKSPSSIINQLDEIVDDAKEKNEQVKNEIKNDKKYHMLFYPNTTRRPKQRINIEKIKKELNLKCNRSERIDQEIILQKNFDKVKICLDEKCRGYLRQIYNQINYEDSQLNKQESIKNFSIENYKNYLLSKQNFRIVAKDTLNLKKSIKGTQAIVPLNDSKAWNKLIREEMCDDISDERYFEELLRKKNAVRNIKSANEFNVRETLNKIKKKKKVISSC